MRASILTLGLVLLAGCTFFGDDGTPLGFQTVGLTTVDSLQIDSDAVRELGYGSWDRLFLIVHSADDAERLRRAAGLDSTAIPDVDWTRESLFVHDLQLQASQRLRVESVRLKRDRIEVEGVVLGNSIGPVRELQTLIVAVRITGAPREPIGLSFRARPVS